MRMEQSKDRQVEGTGSLGSVGPKPHEGHCCKKGQTIHNLVFTSDCEILSVTTTIMRCYLYVVGFSLSLLNEVLLHLGIGKISSGSTRRFSSIFLRFLDRLEAVVLLTVLDKFELAPVTAKQVLM